MKRKGRFLWGVTFLCMITGCWQIMENQIPDHLMVASDGKKDSLLEGFLPEWIEERAVKTNTSHNIECSFMGVVPIKEIQVDVVERDEVIPGGWPVGIYMKTDGVLIIGTGEVCDLEGNIQEPVGEIVQSGDYILEVNGIPVTEKRK